MNNIKQRGEFNYIDEGEGDVIILLHGLFGALSNWDSVINHFSVRYRIIIPLLPIYEMPIRKAGLEGLLKFFENFVEAFQLDNMTLIGNSLGGHVALIYTLKNQDKVNRLVLTGSSGLFENTLGGSYPKRGSYEYMKERVEHTFYNPKIVTREFVDGIIDITKDIPKCLRIVAIAKSAQRHNLAQELPKIKVPTLLIWGLNDTITPPMVAHEFNKLIPNSKLRFIDKCCHAPMMEHPEKFNRILEEYLNQPVAV
ncbi:MAG: alpha/beta fold hydrolase [Candidatus Cyclobacteriaceae bacterium M3_2C_046]